MFQEFVLVNPDDYDTRENPRRRGKRSRVTGRFLKGYRAPPKRRRRKARRRRRSNPGGGRQAAQMVPQVVVVPPNAMDYPRNNPRHRKGRRRRRRNPNGLMRGLPKPIAQAIPIGLGAIAAGFLSRVPQIGPFLGSPVGNLAAGWLVAMMGRQVLGRWAMPLGIGMAVAGLVSFARGTPALGMIEVDEDEAITPVEVDGIAGYFVPGGMEGVFGPPQRRRLPPLAPPAGGGGPPAAGPAPQGVPPRFWMGLGPDQRARIRGGLQDPARRDAMLTKIRTMARARGLLGQADDVNNELDAEMDAIEYDPAIDLAA